MEFALVHNHIQFGWCYAMLFMDMIACFFRICQIPCVYVCVSNYSSETTELFA